MADFVVLARPVRTGIGRRSPSGSTGWACSSVRPDHRPCPGGDQDRPRQPGPQHAPSALAGASSQATVT
jgi:hypothetical protein